MTKKLGKEWVCVGQIFSQKGHFDLYQRDVKGTELKEVVGVTADGSQTEIYSGEGYDEAWGAFNADFKAGKINKDGTEKTLEDINAEQEKLLNDKLELIGGEIAKLFEELINHPNLQLATDFCSVTALKLEKATRSFDALGIKLDKQLPKMPDYN